MRRADHKTGRRGRRPRSDSWRRCRDAQHLFATLQHVVPRAAPCDKPDLSSSASPDSRCPTSGPFVGGDNVARLNSARRSLIKRARWPRFIAVSTTAAIARGVETAASTPTPCVNSDWLFDSPTMALHTGHPEFGSWSANPRELHLVINGVGDHRIVCLHCNRHTECQLTRVVIGIGGPRAPGALRTQSAETPEAGDLRG